MLDIRFQRLVVVVGDSGMDAAVLTTLIPFGQQENGSMKTQYSVENCEVIRSLGKKMQRVQYQTNVKAKLHLGTDHYLSPGGEGGERVEDLGLNKVKFSRSPLWILLHWITFDDFRDPLSPHSPSPTMSSFSKKIWVVPSLNPSKVSGDPPFVLLKIKWSPSPVAINNDRSLRSFH